MRLSHLRSRAFTSPFKQLASRSRSLMVLVLCGVTLAGAVNAAEAPFPGLRTLMDDEQFERSGLNKLSVSERAALNRWLAAHADFELAVITEAPEDLQPRGSIRQKKSSQNPSTEKSVLQRK